MLDSNLDLLGLLAGLLVHVHGWLRMCVSRELSSVQIGDHDASASSTTPRSWKLGVLSTSDVMLPPEEWNISVGDYGG